MPKYQCREHPPDSEGAVSTCIVCERLERQLAQQARAHLVWRERARRKDAELQRLKALVARYVEDDGNVLPRPVENFDDLEEL